MTAINLAGIVEIIPTEITVTFVIHMICSLQTPLTLHQSTLTLNPQTRFSVNVPRVQLRTISDSVTAVILDVQFASTN